MMLDVDLQDSKDVEMLIGLAKVHFLFGQNTTALHILELAKWIDDTNAVTMLLIARSHFNLGNPEMVIKTLDRLEKTSPGHHSSEEELLLRVRSHALLGQDATARNILLAVAN